jgi:hypothetical protein|tara:strand:+ start:853 stop:1032 length:180 start_codon:yes stop_codon:yes gene_type:complete
MLSSTTISKKQSYSEDNFDFELDNISIFHEEKISFELKEYQQSKLRGLMSEIRELLKLV